MIFTCFADLTVRSLLVSRNFLVARGKTAANIVISKDLEDLAKTAHSEYQNFLRKQKKEEEERDAKLREEEEQERVKALVKRDRQRKDELEKINKKEEMLLTQQREAEVNIYIYCINFSNFFSFHLGIYICFKYISDIYLCTSGQSH